MSIYTLSIQPGQRPSEYSIGSPVVPPDQQPATEGQDSQGSRCFDSQGFGFESHCAFGQHVEIVALSFIVSQGTVKEDGNGTE